MAMVENCEKQRAHEWEFCDEYTSSTSQTFNDITELDHNLEPNEQQEVIDHQDQTNEQEPSLSILEFEPNEQEMSQNEADSTNTRRSSRIKH
ncbi:hypothetical protein L6452_18871 [Arctium lappa]|uniref:Uncharacterized protein n=1 Tax=Arctium lappa TaxID=4217 RepID=A0ACB9C7H2_ARCLA|nr:hypothetical protein L6452_18871 [Arctium lappa]